MHVPINVKSPNNISEWQMGFNSAFKGLKVTLTTKTLNFFEMSATTFQSKRSYIKKNESSRKRQWKAQIAQTLGY